MMQSVPIPRIASLLVLPIVFSSCAYGPWPYGAYGGSPYGYPAPTYQGGYPGYQSYPPGTIVPNGSVTPNSVFPQGSSSSSGLQPLPDAQGWDGANKVPEPEKYQGNSTDPFYKSSSLPANPQSNSIGRDVSPATHTNNTGLNTLQPIPRSSQPTFSSQPNTIYSPQPSQTDPMADAIDVNDTSFDGFQPPVVNPQNDLGQPFPADQQPLEIPASPEARPFTLQKVPTPDVSIFDHEPEFRWIRGVVSQDEATGIWSVIYADAPTSQDPYQGHLSLENSPMLENLSEGEIIQVSGQLEPVRKDPLGKPYFLVSAVKKISTAP